MSVTVVSRPNDFASAYVPVEWEFSSTFAGVTGAVSVFQDDGNGKLEIIYSGVSFPKTNLQTGGIITITNNDIYNGEYLVIEKNTNSKLTLDTPYIGDSFGGNMSFSLSNINMVCDLYVNGSVIVRKFRFPDVNDGFVFDFSKELQIELGNNMLPASLLSSNPETESEAYASVYVKYAEIHEELIDEVPTQVFTLDESLSPPDLFSDSANAITVINSTVPYLEWELGSVKSEIASIDTDLSAFKVTSLDTTRFLTNSPKVISIGKNEGYQLNVMIEEDAAIGYALSVITYSSSGGVIQDVQLPLTITLDTVISLPVGTRQLIELPFSVSSILFASSYEVAIVDTLNGDAKITETITFNIRSKCSGSETRFVWLNPRGSYDSYTFRSPRKLNSSVSKDSFNPTRSYPVSIGNREEAVINVRASDSITTRTDKITSTDAEWIQELLESPQVFIELSTLNTGYVPVTLINKTRSICDSYNGLFNVSLRYKFAFEKIGLRAY